MFQPDFTRRQQIAEQHVQDMQAEAARQRPNPDDPDDPRASRQPAHFVVSAPIVLGVIVLLLAILSCVGYVQLHWPWEAHADSLTLRAMLFSHDAEVRVSTMYRPSGHQAIRPSGHHPLVPPLT